MARKIEVVDYRPEWKKLFKAEAKEIKRILGKNCVAVYHIGSTAVPGLKAKPIIDIMPVVKDLEEVDRHNAEFEALGYECMGEFGIPGRRFYRKGGDNRTHHIHIFAQSNQADIQRHLAVRDYLAANPKEAKIYADLKTYLAEAYPNDNDGYCDGKEEFMKELEEKALAAMSKKNHMGQGMSYGMMLGMLLGCALGAASGNMGTYMAVGMCLGMCIGMLWGQKSDGNG